MANRTISSSRPVRPLAGGTRSRFHSMVAGGTGWRCVTQLVERCLDQAEWGAVPLVCDAPSETGTNSSGRCGMMPSSDHPVDLIPMTSNGR
jgi:hypothetical protein